VRLFVGIDLPWEIRERLWSLGGGGVPGARWVPEENYHLTLRFVGEVQKHLAEEIDLALSGLRGKRFMLTITGVGTFSKSGRETTLWAGVERNQRMDVLQGKVEQALQRTGLEPERRRFVPHITLARLDNPVEAKLAAFVQTRNLFRAECDVEHFTLFSSLLTKDSPVYTAEVDYPLL
jgi:2'-5' RNA ligase